MWKRLLTLIPWLGLTAILSLLPAHAQTGPTDPASLPAHDSHQGLLVAVDPYVTAARYKAKFGKQHTPYEAGILALDVYFRNDNDAPIRINLQTVRMIIGAPGQSRQHVDSLSADDVADRVLLNSQKGYLDPSQKRPPVNLPGSVPRGPRNKDWQKFDGALRSLAMSSDVLPPHNTTHGFFYFDVAGHFDWLSNARFEVPDLSFMLDNKELFFFEVDLAPAIH